MAVSEEKERSLFMQAIKLRGPEELKAFLDAVCKDDPELRANLDALLSAHGKRHSLLDVPDHVRPTDDDSIAEGPGAVIGSYKLLEQIGEGGFGVVFMAEQIQPKKRKVALKILKPGIDSKEVTARFEAERQALALMDHPNIAKVLDTGTTETGRPYFVMELVKGMPITQYSDQHHMTINERLQLFVQACNAVQHAHQKGIIHRDLKPPNILVALHDAKPVTKVIDFGVVKAVGVSLTERTLFTGFGALVGTLEYMSPEQAQLNELDVDTRSDVYSLGVVLYELLTGTTPLERKSLEDVPLLDVLGRIRADETPRPSLRLHSVEDLPGIASNRSVEPKKLDRLLRHELDWIVMKPLEKDRNRRYETASAFAEDVKCYLNQKPVQACPPSLPYRLGKFVKRNKSRVAWVFTLIVILLMGTGIAGWSWVRANNAHLAKLESEKQSATKLANERQYDLYIQEIQRKRLTVSLDHHRDDVLGLVRKAAEIRRDDELKNQAAGVLIGYSARSFKTFDFGVSSVAFDANGSRLLMGGWKDRPASVWKVGLTAPEQSKRSGFGPVAFQGGTPLQMVIDSENPSTLLVWDLAKQKPVQALPLKDAQLAQTRSFANMALSKNGRFAGAILTAGKKKKKTVTVWETATGKVVNVIPMAAETIAFSHDAGGLLAIGGTDGSIQVWDLLKGQEPTTLHFGRTPITSLAFGRSTVFYGKGKGVEHGLLAAGDAGSEVRIIDLEKKSVASYCRGSAGEVLALAFSPDGVTLASGGRARAKLWDIVTGNLLLNLSSGSFVTGLAFAPGGARLAVSYVEGFGWAPGCKVWDLENGAGIRSLRGMTSSVYQARFSADGELIAALSYSWKICIWDKAGRLLHVFDAPIGVTPDNAGFNFSPGNSEFACVTGTKARLWSLKTGELIREWSLPIGLIDHLVFDSKGKLFVFRVETDHPDVPPFGGTDWRKFPRIAVLRELQRDGKANTIETIRWYKKAVFAAEYSVDGKFLVTDGFGGVAGKERHVKLLDGFTGKEIWSKPTEYRVGTTWLKFDPAGELLFYPARVDERKRTIGHLVKVESRELVASTTDSIHCMTNGASYYAERASQRHGVVLHRGVRTPPLVTLGIDVPTSGVRLEFNRAGDQLVWGNLDGAVFVADLDAVRQKLEEVDMGW